jgi:hypothetical protein
MEPNQDRPAQVGSRCLTKQSGEDVLRERTHVEPVELRWRERAIDADRISRRVGTEAERNEDPDRVLAQPAQHEGKYPG